MRILLYLGSTGGQIEGEFDGEERVDEFEEIEEEDFWREKVGELDKDEEFEEREELESEFAKGGLEEGSGSKEGEGEIIEGTGTELTAEAREGEREGEGGREGERDLRQGRVSANVDPFPFSDFIDIVPFINFANFLQIFSLSKK